MELTKLFLAIPFVASILLVVIGSLKILSWLLDAVDAFQWRFPTMAKVLWWGVYAASLASVILFLTQVKK